MKLKIIVSMLAGAGLMFGGTQFALATDTHGQLQESHHHEQKVERGEYILHKMTEKLHLTKEQQTKIRSIMMTHKGEMRSNREKIRDLRKQMREIVFSNNYDADKVANLSDTLTKVMDEQIKLRAEVMHQVYNVLTPKQRVEFKKLVHERIHKMKEKAHMMMEKETKK